MFSFDIYLGNLNLHIGNNPKLSWEHLEQHLWISKGRFVDACIKNGTSKYSAKSNTLCTSLSEPSKSLGVFAVVRAREYCVHNGLAQMQLILLEKAGITFKISTGVKSNTFL